MAGLGQLLAGVAHEINNPVSFIFGNLIHLNEYIQELLNTVKIYRQNSSLPPTVQEKLTRMIWILSSKIYPKLLIQ